MVRIRSEIAVTGLVTAALATVGVLTAQASDAPLRQHTRASATTPASRPVLVRLPDALPAGSGSGERVVYGIGAHRVWLVDAHERVARTFGVRAGDVPPALGVHRVFARQPHGPGADGTRVEHVVLFASTGGANVGFNAAADGARTPPDPHRLAAAIREQPADAAAMWQRATIGTIVEVVR
jgi:hypothetical protein